MSILSAGLDSSGVHQQDNGASGQEHSSDKVLSAVHRYRCGQEPQIRGGEEGGR